VRPGEAAAPAQLPSLAPGVHINSGRVELVRGVVLESEVLGTIYLRAHYDVSGRVRAYLSVLGAVMVIGLIAALLASSWLHRVVSQPMESMAGVARQIVEQARLLVPRRRTTHDEIGVVIDAFNNMLDEVQARSRAPRDQ
jgi:methyl-accepting chemotaxis protein